MYSFRPAIYLCNERSSLMRPTDRPTDLRDNGLARYLHSCRTFSPSSLAAPPRIVLRIVSCTGVGNYPNRGRDANLCLLAAFSFDLGEREREGEIREENRRNLWEEGDGRGVAVNGFCWKTKQRSRIVLIFFSLWRRYFQPKG